MKPLQRQGLIELWYDRDISAGVEWEQEIDEQLNMAQIILLLVSPDFLASDYCYSKEIKQALERHARKEACVIPILLRPSFSWEPILGKLQALPTDAIPVTRWINQDEAFNNIATGIQKAIEKFFSIANQNTQAKSKQQPLPPIGNDLTSPVQKQPVQAQSYAQVEMDKVPAARTTAGTKLTRSKNKIYLFTLFASLVLFVVLPTIAVVDKNNSPVYVILEVAWVVTTLVGLIVLILLSVQWVKKSKLFRKR